jgi:2-isopropylmalate synthase
MPATVKPEYLTRASKLVSAVSSFPVQYNKAIVGRNAFAHESGIHQDGMLKNQSTYEIMTPESVGVSQDVAGHGQAFGPPCLPNPSWKSWATSCPTTQLQDAFVRFKALADRKKHVYDEDIEALVDEGIASAADRMKVVALTVIAGTMGPQTATLTLDIDGQQATVQSVGNGPVDATFNAIHQIYPHEAKLALYDVHAVTEGTDAQAEVSVRLEDVTTGRQVTGRSADPDTLVASAKAYIAALSKLEVKMVRGDTTAPAKALSGAERRGP